MPINGSEIIDQPMDTIFEIFVSILTSGFWLIPIGFIATALYVKTRTVTASSVWLMASCLILGTGNIFSDYPEMAFVFFIFAVIGFVGTVVSLYLMKK